MMYRQYLPILVSVLILSCNKNETDEINPDEEIIPEAEAPLSVELIHGNNQVGYPDEYLGDTIVIEVIPVKAEHAGGFTFSIQSMGSGSRGFGRDTVINDKYYVNIAWKINELEEQILTVFIENKIEKLNGPGYTKYESIDVFSKVKRPWELVFEGDPLRELLDIHFSDENSGIVVGDLSTNEGYLKTSDGGASWDYSTYDRSDLYQLSFSDPDTGIVILTNNYARFTHDGGQTFFKDDWTPPIIGHQSSGNYFLFNSKEMLSVGRNGGITKTIDGGKTWTVFDGFTFINFLYDITCTDQNTCYACGEVGKVIKTIDGGDTWEEQEVLLNNNLKTVYFIDNNFGFVGGQDGALARTTDGGTNWEVLQSGLIYEIVEIVFQNDIGYMVSSHGEIAVTEDGGDTWELLLRANYHVNDLNRAHLRNQTIFGLNRGSIFKYELSE